LADTVTHPDFGELRWEPKSGWWFAQIELPSGERLEVLVQPGEEDRFAFLDRGAELFRWALGAQPQILRDALQSELLELYNDVWREPTEPELTAEELAGRLAWSTVEVSASDLAPVVFGYEAADLFGGHTLAIEVDSELRFRDVDLQG
jgi:hypothetical protein